VQSRWCFEDFNSSYSRLAQVGFDFGEGLLDCLRTLFHANASDLVTERSSHAARMSLLQTTVPVQGVARHLGFGSAPVLRDSGENTLARPHSPAAQPRRTQTVKPVDGPPNVANDPI